MKTTIYGLCALLLFSFACNSDSEVAPLPNTTIDSGGGTVTSEDGTVTIDVPPGAVTTSVNITIEETTSHPGGNLGKVYELGPDGIDFENPVVLEMQFDPTQLAGSSDGSSVAVAYAENGKWVMVPTTLNASNQTVSAEIPHFSTWTTLEVITGTGSQPEVNAGPENRSAILDNATVLDASASTDPDGDNLSFIWSLFDSPAGSQAVISNPTNAIATFSPDVEGLYRIIVTADDPSGNRDFQLIHIEAGEPIDLGTETLSGVITEDRRLENRITDTSTPDYIVSGNLVVSALLEIDPGVIIEFEQNALLRVINPGNLIAVGLTDQEIIFRGTIKQKGHWQGINIVNRFDDPAIFDHVIIQHAGADMDVGGFYGAEIVKGNLVVGAVGQTVGVELSQPGVKISNSIINESAGYGIRYYYDGLFELKGTTITECDAYPVCMFPFGLQGLMEDNMLSGNGVDKVQLLGGIIGWPTTIPALDVPYEVGTPRDFIINEDALSRTNLQTYKELTIEAGVEMEFIENSGLIAVADGDGGGNSFIKANGTADNPVVFKSSGSHYWQGIDIESSNPETHLDYALISGVFYGIDLGAVGGITSYLRITNSDIRYDGCGIRLLTDQYVLFTDNIFYDGDENNQVCE